MKNMKIHINQIKILNINTKEIAEFLSELKDCKVVLGSATPTIESYYKAINRRIISLLNLIQELMVNICLQMNIVDMREELKVRK